MNNSDKLIPVSFHLRNFNLYRHLDIQLSEHGNIALVGENAVGKTTLANCFFPMLVDGSIATPSFNPTTDTNKLKNSVNPRNSSHDSRTFESMLLGWGKGAMKVRTGYAYEVLASKYREVILGIGAYRAKGDPRSQTWWFIAVNDDPQLNLTVQTTDENGKSLDKESFIQANSELGNHFYVVEKARDFRDRVAAEVYGLSGQELGLLTQADRMIASPMLTAGNAKFEPIREALIQSQQRIDPEIIRQAAKFQQQVNNYQSLKKRIEAAIERVNRIKQLIFWGNCASLSKSILEPYSTAQNLINEHLLKIEKLTKRVDLTKQTLTTQQQTLVNAEEKFSDLQLKKQQEKLIEQQRKQVNNEIRSLTKAIKLFEENTRRKTALLKEQSQNKRDIQAFTHQLDTLMTDKVNPLKVEIQSLLVKLGWDDLVGSTKLTSDNLGETIKSVRALINDYQRWLSNSQNLTDSIQVFNGTKDQMDERIDIDVTGFHTGPMKEKLHGDNRLIHEGGAAKISVKYDSLKKRMQSLLEKHPEMTAALDDGQLLKNAESSRENLISLGKQADLLQVNIKQAETKRVSIEERLGDINANMDPDFDITLANKTIDDLQERLTTLKIDPSLTTRLNQQIEVVEKLREQIDKAKGQVISDQSTIESRREQINAEKQRIASFSQRIDVALGLLRPYISVNLQINNIDDLTAYCADNRAAIRSNSISELGSRVGSQINHNQERLDHNAVNVLFNELGEADMASKMFPDATEQIDETVVTSFDIDKAMKVLESALNNVVKALNEMENGRSLANQTYQAAVVQRIASQYHSIRIFNEMLSEGTGEGSGIKLKIELTPQDVEPKVIQEALDASLETRPAIQAAINQRLNQLANDEDLANDEQLFNKRADELLDTRYWSQFVVKIKRRHSSEDEYEVVDDRFVESGGSGAEKAQAMVLPLLLVPKMILARATKKDAPYMVMFDEFADKLDTETARIFAKTINRFGFNFIATMPGGAQSKLLSDGVDNITYQVIAPKNRDDGKFHTNRIEKIATWAK